MSVLPFADPFGWYPAEHYGHRHFRWNPLRDMERMDRSRIDEPLDRMMNTVFSRDQPLEDLIEHIDYNDRGDMTIRCETSGFRPEELCVDLDGDQLTVSGRRIQRHDSGGQQHQQKEHFFTRSVQLDGRLFDATLIECKFNEAGELLICIPRRHQPPDSMVQQQRQQAIGEQEDKFAAGGGSPQLPASGQQFPAAGQHFPVDENRIETVQRDREIQARSGGGDGAFGGLFEHGRESHGVDRSGGLEPAPPQATFLGEGGMGREPFSQQEARRQSGDVVSGGEGI